MSGSVFQFVRWREPDDPMVCGYDIIAEQYDRAAHGWKQIGLWNAPKGVEGRLIPRIEADNLKLRVVAMRYDGQIIHHIEIVLCQLISPEEPYLYTEK